MRHNADPTPLLLASRLVCCAHSACTGVPLNPHSRTPPWMAQRPCSIPCATQVRGVGDSAQARTRVVTRLPRTLRSQSGVCQCRLELQNYTNSRTAPGGQAPRGKHVSDRNPIFSDRAPPRKLTQRPHGPPAVQRLLSRPWPESAHPTSIRAVVSGRWVPRSPY